MDAYLIGTNVLFLPVRADHEAIRSPTLILSVSFLKGAWNSWQLLMRLAMSVEPD